MAAVTGDAEKIKGMIINKQARILRTNWVTNKQTADGFLPRFGLYTLFSAKAIYILCIIFSLGPLYSREYSRILRIF